MSRFFTTQTPTQPVQDPQSEQLLSDQAQQQLNAIQPNTGYPTAPAVNNPTYPNTTNPGAVSRPGTVTYPYATKVPNRPGFVYNPYTRNQVDVRGIPQGTLVLDPNDNDSTHKFRVP